MKKKVSGSHPIMSAYYVSTIAQTLRDAHGLIDPNFISYINSNYPDWNWDRFYLYMAFEGLDGTPEYLTHRNNPDYLIEAQSYIGRNSTAFVNSTKVPKCDN